MPKQSSRKRGKQGPEDVNEIAFRVAQEATGGAPPEVPSGNNPAAVALGHLGGLKGGKARAVKLSAEQRSEIARKAALARWSSKL
jgi:hypothetical protein